MADTTTNNLLSAGINAAGTVLASNNAVNAANTAAQMSQFRPVGITSRFGTSGFNYGPNGQLIGAGYQVAPDIAAMREGLLSLAGGQLSRAQTQQAYQPTVTSGSQGLFNLGQGYIAQSPQAQAQNWMTNQQNLLAPGREQQLAALTNQQQQQGRLGLAVGGTTAGYTAGGQGLAATNPQMAAYYNAMAQQDAQLAAQAQQQGIAQAQAGQGLMSGALALQNAGYGLQTAALNPYTSYINAANAAENMGQAPLTLGQSLGSAAAASQAQAAQQYMQGQQAQTAAITGAVAGLADPVARLIGNLSTSTTASPAATAAYNQATQYAATSPTGWLDF